MTKLLSSPRFLAAYSGLLTLAFLFSVLCGLSQGDFRLHRVSAAEQSSGRNAEYDSITVHRINIVEPDGTPRLVISDKAEFPGQYFKSKDLPRPDRRGSAGMLFINDEGTEQGGLTFRGQRSSDGKIQSSGGLTFDEYEQDQTVQIGTSEDGEDVETGYQINDNGSTLFTPEVAAALQSVHAMPEGPAKEKARAEFGAKYPMALRTRAGFARLRDKSSEFALCDPQGRTRIRLRVAPDGNPSMQFLDATGKVTHQWPEAPNSK
ncbi:MAG TPA: hypothetical protein VFW25_07930 [Silvibacterium sp.]|nr:hypothetical protein [Silvibacterium sp.]